MLTAEQADELDALERVNIRLLRQKGRSRFYADIPAYRLAGPLPSLLLPFDVPQGMHPFGRGHSWMAI